MCGNYLFDRSEIPSHLLDCFEEVEVQCGAPWRRVTNEEKLIRKRPRDFVKRKGEKGTGNVCANTVAGVEVKTIGWEPTCDCGRNDVVPCTVLDPFNGSGTSGVVSVKLGHRYIGIDLSAEYIELSNRRIGRAADKAALDLFRSQKLRLI